MIAINLPSYAKMQAINVMVFVHVGVKHLVSEVQSAVVACGIGNTLGNKGAVGVSFKIANSRVVLVGCHLQAHEHELTTRNSQLHKIYNDLPGLLSKHSHTSTTTTQDKIMEGEVIDSANNDSKSHENQASQDIDTTQNVTSSPLQAHPPSSSPQPSSVMASKSTTLEVTEVEQRATQDLSEYADILIFMGDMNYRINGNT